ncbi:MAG: DUF1565 domain-containing protein, partial [candidate division Zixibacteria bacterium]|nr:DUF1565 domain-containing protein [candidate division Zixibacteria bacterium]
YGADTNCGLHMIGTGGNTAFDPIFCDYENGDYTIGEFSPCAPNIHECGELIGALGVGCIHPGFDLTFHVAVDGDNDAGIGSPEHPFATIQFAIDRSQDRDTIIVHDGTYIGRGNHHIRFAGRSIVVRSENGPEVTIIDGESHSIGFKFDSNEDSTSILEGFTIANGYYANSNGGGVVCTGSSPTLRNLIITNCTANSGGGMYLAESSATIDDCLIVGNSCPYIGPYGRAHGGGIYLRQSNPTITNCTIVGNHAASCGPALYLSSSAPSISNTVIAFNSGPSTVCCYSTISSPILNCCDVYGNEDGDWGSCIEDQADINGNFSLDPVFCDTAAGDYHLSGLSPCLPEANSCGQLVGAYGLGCEDFNNLWHVSIDGDDLLGDGTMGNPYATIQYGIDMAQVGDMVMVWDGTYTGEGNREINFGGKGIIVKSASGAETTIIDCEMAYRGFDFQSNEDSTSILDGFTITNGRGYNGESGTHMAGGGIRCQSSSPTLRNLIVTDCEATLGGGLCLFESNAIIDRCLLAGNSCPELFTFPNPANGAGIYLANSNPTIVNCTLVDNWVPPSTGKGAALYLHSSIPTITNTIIALNRGPSTVYCESAHPTFSCSNIYDNEGGDWTGCIADQAEINGNFSLDPIFCQASTGNYHLRSDSKCTKDNADCGVQIGALGIGCYANAGPTWYVSPDGDDIDGDGGEFYPVATIKRALELSASANSAHIILKDGIYSGDGNRDMELGDRAVTFRSVNGPESTIIDLGGTKLDQHFGFHAVGISGGNYPQVTIEGLTIKNGYTHRGSAIYAESTTIRILNNIITGGTTTSHGGGIFLAGSLVLIKGNIIENNHAAFGGGISAWGQEQAYTIQIIDNTIRNNTTSSTLYTPTGGGVLCMDAANLIFENNVVVGNAAEQGGGLYISGTDCTLTQITLANNSAGMGSAILAHQGAVKLKYSIVAYSKGGSCVDHMDGRANGSVTLSCCDVYGNEGGDWTGYIADQATLRNNYRANPIFCDTASGDYNISTNSPCLPASTGCSEITGAGDTTCTLNLWNGPNWYVSVSGDDLTGDGSNDYPFATIQNTINSAHEGDTVVVTNGTYTGDGNRDIDFNGKGLVLRSLGGPEVTIIDCQGTEQEPYRGFLILNGEDSTTIIEGFTVRNGRAPGGAPYGLHFGGAILCMNSSPTIRMCVLEFNMAGFGGGICCADSSKPIIEDVTISGNIAYANGGAIACYQSNPELRNCTISGNKATRGGGLYCSFSNPVVDNCIITNNTAFGDPDSESARGGAICAFDESRPIIANSVIAGNGSAGYGGAIYSRDNSKPIIIHVTMVNNWAPAGAGIYVAASDTVASVRYSLIVFNGDGSAVVCDSAAAPVFKCTDIYGNTGGDWVGCIADQAGIEGNLSADPLFCDTTGGEFGVRTDSPTLPLNNSCGELLGALRVEYESCEPPMA